MASPSVSHVTIGKMKLQKVEGINYMCFGMIEDMGKQLQAVYDFELRDEDIISIGYPRSGNHLMFEIAHMILDQVTSFTKKMFYASNLEYAVIRLRKTLSPRYISTHLRVTNLPKEIFEKHTKLIYIMRNPKDVFVSMYRLLSTFKADSERFDGSWDEFFELQLAGNLIYGSWFEHVLLMERFMEEHPEIPVYIFSFEGMKQDPVRIVKELCNFLRKSDTLAEEIARVTEFTNMKQTLKERKLKFEEKASKAGSDVMFRAGAVGGWKNYFTVAQSERFDKTFEEKLHGSKLADIVREYL